MNPNQIVLNELPPRVWFEQAPENVPVNKIYVTDEGRVYGRIADPNIRYVDSKQKVELDETNFVYAHQGFVDTQDGQITAGVIAADLEHAPLSMSPQAQAQWNAGNMANTSRQLVQVVYKNDPDGTIQVLGSVIPFKTTMKEVLDIRRTPISGHWRQIWDERIKKPAVALLGAIFVNQPGFRMDLGQIKASIEDLDEEVFYVDEGRVIGSETSGIILGSQISKEDSMELEELKNRLIALETQTVAAAPADAPVVDFSSELAVIAEKQDAILGMLTDLTDAIGTLVYG